MPDEICRRLSGGLTRRCFTLHVVQLPPLLLCMTSKSGSLPLAPVLCSSSSCRWPGFFVPDYERHMGMVYAGDYSRLRAALHRHRTTGNLTVVVVGGSISAGAGAVDTHA
jgi:hypothetical protein